MKKASKHKSKKTASRKLTKKPGRYPAYILGIVLAVVLLSEGALLLNATPNDWKAGLSVLDASSGVSSMVSDVKLALAPTNFTFHAVDDFYNQAAVASTELLDASNPDSDSLMAVLGVNNFYKVASQEMANVLDLSNLATSWQPKVAGASISQ